MLNVIQKYCPIFYTLLFIMVFAIDRFSKIWAIELLCKGTQSVCTGFDLSLAINKGVSWSLFSSPHIHTRYLIISGNIFLLIALAVYAYNQVRNNRYVVPEVMIMGGAVGNVFDRFYYGGVIDFIDLYIGSWHWPTFNIADICIVIGVVLLFIRMEYYD